MRILDNIVESFVDFPTGEPTLVVYTTGCSIACPGCHNKELQSKDSGIDVEPKMLAKRIIGMLSVYPNYALTFQGGEPTEQMDDVSLVLGLVREFYPKIKTCIYTGKNKLPFDMLKKNIDYVCSGSYREKEKTDQGDGFRLASKNQQVWKLTPNVWTVVSTKGILNENF